jgi:hypothetical protein
MTPCQEGMEMTLCLEDLLMLSLKEEKGKTVLCAQMGWIPSWVTIRQREIPFQATAK